MKLSLKLLTICFCIGIILFSIERFFLPFERMQLYGVWLTTSAELESKRDSPFNNPQLEELATMLKTSETNSFAQSVALDLSKLVSQSPLIKEQLLVLSENHPDKFVRCQIKNQLASGMSITLITGEGENRVSSTFVDLPNQECFPNP
ncbi:hypothetical protein [Glaciecola petra]|uniref:DUF2939 domain-containing protein n=1 Tax=Glaciecola petra TaxID=3075602 RepID=A0ABU2ZQL3_9ALTE|nr:hypothetical protein [Aestuariibacter sp. P117]MDT0594910.1 hypothetical protein [Aestuariibacter sp. P117]